jgi:murein DD-endopeptidase MepM/ murein hydrolase activator NlpD
MNGYRIILSIVLVLLFLLSCTARSRGVYHLVKEHETLTGIARTYDCNISAIARANRMKTSAELKTGSVIFIPGAKEVRNVKPPETAVRKPAPPIPPRQESPREILTSTPLEDASSPPKKISLMFYWPVKGKILARFGPQPNGLRNTGIKIDANEDTPVAASESGTVIYAGPIKYFGRTVIMKHSGHFTTVYANLKDISSREGDIVTRGVHIATVGRDEQLGKSCLHFEIRYKNSVLNPLEYLTDAR